jgi:hypothetical protein
MKQLLRTIGNLDKFSRSNYITYRQLGSNGRLGNQLWQIFSTVGLAKLHRKTPILPTWSYMESFSFPKNLFRDVIPALAIESPFFAKHLKSQSIYLQDLKLIRDIGSEISQWTIPSEKIAEAIEVLDSKYNFKKRHAMHIRRGDYVALSNYHSLPPAIWFKEQLKDSTLIFSDDPRWCVREFPGVEIFDKNEIISFHSMRLCGDFTISASSFSWWAAFLSQSTKVTYPAPWAQVDLNQWNTDLLIPKNFFGIPFNV